MTATEHTFAPGLIVAHGDGSGGVDITFTPSPILRALMEAQRAIRPVGKNAWNDQQGYNYAAGDDIIAEARAALLGAGLMLMPVSSTRLDQPFQFTDDGGVVRQDVEFRLLVTFRLVHEAGAVHDFPPFSVPVVPGKGRPMDKAEAGARTYALAYFLRDLLLIPRVAVDANTETHPDNRDDRAHVPQRRTSARPSAPRDERPPAQLVTPPAPTSLAKPPKTRTPEEVRRRYDGLCTDFEDHCAEIDKQLEPFGGIFQITPENATQAYVALGKYYREHIEPSVKAAAPGATPPTTAPSAAPVREPQLPADAEPEPRPNSPEDLGVNRDAKPLPPPKKPEAVGALGAKVRELRSKCDHAAGKLGGDAPARLLEEFDRIGPVVWEPEQFGTVEQARAMSQLGTLQTKLLEEQRQKNTAAPSAT